jgi:hypothetical protein
MVSGPPVVVCEVHLASRRVELLGSMLFNFEIPAKRDSNPPVRHDTPNQPPWVQVIGMSAESVLWGKLMLAIDRGDEQDVAELLKVGPCRLSRTTKVRLISPRLRSNRLNQGMPAQPLPPVTPRLGPSVRFLMPRFGIMFALLTSRCGCVLIAGQHSPAQGSSRRQCECGSTLAGQRQPSNKVVARNSHKPRKAGVESPACACARWMRVV